ncbi:MAG TPA: hypothetical protein VG346_09265 [Acidimicrobiales bacterium]|nr:hypothetical protein [Acidimicrobiales bacterium]
MATAGAAAWVVPEILTAKPAAGATLSGTTSGGGGTTGSGSKPVTNPSTTSGTPGGTAGTLTAATSPTTPGSTLAFTGIDIQRDAEIGAALIAGGWAMHHWASRAPKPAAGGHEAGSSDQPV